MDWSSHRNWHAGYLALLIFDKSDLKLSVGKVNFSMCTRSTKEKSLYNRQWGPSKLSKYVQCKTLQKVHCQYKRFKLQQVCSVSKWERSCKSIHLIITVFKTHFTMKDMFDFSESIHHISCLTAVLTLLGHFMVVFSLQLLLYPFPERWNLNRVIHWSHIQIYIRQTTEFSSWSLDLRLAFPT